jgi:hypothetical protein
MQCMGDNMEEIFTSKMFVNIYLTELHYFPIVGNLAAVTSCVMPCFAFTENSRLG